MVALSVVFQWVLVAVRGVSQAPRAPWCSPGDCVYAFQLPKKNQISLYLVSQSCMQVKLCASARGETQPNNWTLHCIATFPNVKTLNKFHALYTFKKTIQFQFSEVFAQYKSKIASY